MEYNSPFSDREFQYDTEVYMEMKKRTMQMLYPAIEIVYNPEIGYQVIAKVKIIPYQLIREYNGEVVHESVLDKLEHDGNFLLMEVHEPNIKSLTIVPFKHSNIGYFISGINNSKKDCEG